MKFIKKVQFRHVIRLVRLPLLTAVVVALGVDIWCETVGVPDVFAQIFSASLEKKGIACTVGRMKAGVFRGVRANDIVVWDGPAGGRKMFYAECTKLTFRKKDLLFASLIPKRLRVYGGKVIFPVPEANVRPQPLNFVFEDMYADVRIASTEVTFKRLSGKINGIRLRLNGALVGMDEFNPADPPEQSSTSVAGSPSPVGWDTLHKTMHPRLAGALAKIKDLLAVQLFVAEDAFVDGTFHADLTDFGTCRGSFAFQLSGLVLNDVPIATLKGQLDLVEKRFELKRVSARLGADSFASGEVSYAVDSQLLSGNISGAFNPRVIYYFLDTPMPPAAVDFTFAIPPRIRILLSPSPVLSVRDWRVDGTLSAGNVAWRGNRLGALSCTFKQQNRKISVSNFEILVDEKGEEKLTVSGELDENDWGVKGHLMARVNPNRVLPFLPPARPELITFWRQLSCRDGDYPELSITLNEASFSPMNIKGEGRLTGRQLSYRKNTIEQYDIPLVFDGRTITTAASGATLKIDGDQHLNISGKVNLADQKFSLRGNGALVPPRLYKSMGLPRSYLMDELTMGKTPAQISFAMTDVPFDMKSWILSGHVAAEGFAFGKVKVSRATSDFDIEATSLSLKNLTADSTQIQDLSIPELTVTWPRTTVSFTAGRGRFDPRYVAPFISPQGRAGFLKSLAAFDWGDPPPDVQVKSFMYRYLGSERWDLHLDGWLTDKNMAFHNLPFDSFKARVLLSLPESIKVEQVDVTHGPENAKGQVSIDLGSEPILSFDCQGIFDPVKKATAVMPHLQETFADVSASENSQVFIDGQVYLKGKLRPLINCRMTGSRLVARKLPLENYDVDWNLDNHELRWRINKGGVGGGQLVAGGHSNGFTGAGKVEATFKQLSLNQLLKSYANVDSKVNLGRVDGEVSLFSSKAPGDEAVTLTGDGKLKIRDGEFNKTFIVQKLVSLIGLGKVGLITACDAELEFCGDYLKVARLATDGTIVSLKGTGTYYWGAKDDNELDFVVSGEVLKAISLVPLLTKPLSWFFEAQLTGSVDNPVWKMRSPLRIFSGDKKSKESEKEMELELLPDR